MDKEYLLIYYYYTQMINKGDALSKLTNLMEKLIGSIGNLSDIHSRIFAKTLGVERNAILLLKCLMEIFMIMQEDFYVNMKKYSIFFNL